ncbi:hypothetical protein RM697_02340 [Ichthyenterobacterium sp. W332]|uniref:Uncharacterized protein n=1 Tax=Microcosmobacter mediterraneus TaxID=3075607 RepID=A0ABU2YH04_9FLAO|nr:hypothetical protein [Ichthyenterobacterium sp. W332]MDT0557469.1 hypothetical protein [Ichthyenterobacterium sp. W332]
MKLYSTTQKPLLLRIRVSLILILCLFAFNITSAQNDKHESKNIQWINFKIKNNSKNRNHFVVKGPKAEGSKFGYGFPMMPYEKRKEKWSVGTKIYKENKLGFRKLLVTITANDEGKVVNLFK